MQYARNVVPFWRDTFYSTADVETLWMSKSWWLNLFFSAGMHIFVRYLCYSSLMKLSIGCIKVLNPYPSGALWFQSGYKNNWQRRLRDHVLKHNLKSAFLRPNRKVRILLAETECWYHFNTFSLTPNSHPTPTPSPQWYYPNDDYTFACVTYTFVVRNNAIDPRNYTRGLQFVVFVMHCTDFCDCAGWCQWSNHEGPGYYNKTQIHGH